MHPNASETTQLTDKQRKELEHIEQLARGNRLDHSGSTARSLKLSKPERLAFEQAKRQGYLVASSTYNQVRSIWFLWCRTMVHPYVIVTPRRRYAAVDLDLVAYHDIVEFTPEGVAAARDLLHRYTPAGRQPARRDRGLFACYVNRELAAHTDVPVEDADDLALELIQLAKEHAVVRPRPWQEHAMVQAPGDAVVR
jgi:hypothetical protein